MKGNINKVHSVTPDMFPSLSIRSSGHKIAQLKGQPIKGQGHIGSYDSLPSYL